MVHFRKDAAGQGISDEAALEVGLQEKAKEFVKKGLEVLCASICVSTWPLLKNIGLGETHHPNDSSSNYPGRDPQSAFRNPKFFCCSA
jgi:hypothetical protein